MSDAKLKSESPLAFCEFVQVGVSFAICIELYGEFELCGYLTLLNQVREGAQILRFFLFFHEAEVALALVNLPIYV